MIFDSLTIKKKKKCNFYVFVYKNESVNVIEIFGLLSRKKKLKTICIYNLKKKVFFDANFLCLKEGGGEVMASIQILFTQILQTCI